MAESKKITPGIYHTLLSISIHKRGVFGTPEFFETADRFLEAWMNGYKKGESGARLHGHTKGFQLEYVNWDENSSHYRIGAWEGLNLFGAVESIIIATDLNGLVDSGDYMSLGINDFDNRRVLAYKPLDELSNPSLSASWREKRFMEDEPVYLWVGGESFPFESRNPLKAAPYIWIMVGLKPQDVYDGFGKLGFVFPEITRP